MENFVVTGFGPFANHPINASWEAVRLLDESEMAQYGIKLVTKEIKVEYDTVVNTVKELWATENPQLMVHVGVSSEANKLTLETNAHRNGYEKLDVSGKKPEGGMCPIDGAPYIQTGIDVVEIYNQFHATSAKTEVCISHDAGRYLCEFIYYCSLAIEPTKTLFVHVPPIGKPYSSEEMAKGLGEILRLCVDQLRARKISS